MKNKKNTLEDGAIRAETCRRKVIINVCIL
jgi:hypothetical protein